MKTLGAAGVGLSSMRARLVDRHGVVNLAAAAGIPHSRVISVLPGKFAGVLIGTVGLAAEWGWSHVWWTVEWPSSMLVEGVVAGFVTAVAGGVLGAYIGRAVTAADVRPRPAPRFALPAALVAVVAVVAYATPISSGNPVTAHVTRGAGPRPARSSRRRRPRSALVSRDRLARQGGPLRGGAAEEDLPRGVAHRRADPGLRHLEVLDQAARWNRRAGPAGLLPRGRGDSREGDPRAAELHPQVCPRQEAPPA